MNLQEWIETKKCEFIETLEASDDMAACTGFASFDAPQVKDWLSTYTAELVEGVRFEAKLEANQEIIEMIGDWPYCTRDEYKRFREGGAIKWRTVREALQSLTKD